VGAEDRQRGELTGGIDYPRNWHEFLSFFSSDEQCLVYLARLRWPDRFRCPWCEHDHYWLRGDGRHRQ
jgi:Transposase zinc-ribbon domain